MAHQETTEPATPMSQGGFSEVSYRSDDLPDEGISPTVTASSHPNTSAAVVSKHNPSSSSNTGKPPIPSNNRQQQQQRFAQPDSHYTHHQQHPTVDTSFREPSGENDSSRTKVDNSQLERIHRQFDNFEDNQQHRQQQDFGNEELLALTSGSGSDHHDQGLGVGRGVAVEAPGSFDYESGRRISHNPADSEVHSPLRPPPPHQGNVSGDYGRESGSTILSATNSTLGGTVLGHSATLKPESSQNSLDETRLQPSEVGAMQQRSGFGEAPPKPHIPDYNNNNTKVTVSQQAPPPIFKEATQDSMDGHSPASPVTILNTSSSRTGGEKRSKREKSEKGSRSKGQKISSSSGGGLAVTDASPGLSPLQAAIKREKDRHKQRVENYQSTPDNQQQQQQHPTGSNNEEAKLQILHAGPELQDKKVSNNTPRTTHNTSSSNSSPRNGSASNPPASILVAPSTTSTTNQVVTSSRPGSSRTETPNWIKDTEGGPLAPTENPSKSESGTHSRGSSVVNTPLHRMNSTARGTPMEQDLRSINQSVHDLKSLMAKRLEEDKLQADELRALMSTPMSQIGGAAGNPHSTLASGLTTRRGSSTSFKEVNSSSGIVNSSTSGVIEPLTLNAQYASQVARRIGGAGSPLPGSIDRTASMSGAPNHAFGQMATSVSFAASQGAIALQRDLSGSKSPVTLKEQNARMTFYRSLRAGGSKAADKRSQLEAAEASVGLGGNRRRSIALNFRDESEDDQKASVPRKKSLLAGFSRDETTVLERLRNPDNQSRRSTGGSLRPRSGSDLAGLEDAERAEAASRMSSQRGSANRGSTVVNVRDLGGRGGSLLAADKSFDRFDEAGVLENDKSGDNKEEEEELDISRQSGESPESHQEDAGNESKGKGVAARRQQRKGGIISVSSKSWWKSYSTQSHLISGLDLLYLIVAFATCVIAMYLVHPQAKLISLNEFPPVGLIIFFVAVQLFSAIWVLSRFIVRQRKGEWEIIDDLAQIKHDYIRGWFIFDMLYTFPLELIFLGWRNDAYYYLSCRHFLRLGRVASLGRNDNPLIESRQWFRLVSFFGVLFLFLGAEAGIFWALEEEQNLSFLDSAYWAVVTMTSVGYGDVVSRSGPGGQIFTALACIIGVLLIASLTAFATSYLTSKDILAEELDRKKKMMYSMLDYYEIPWEVQREVISLFPTVLAAQSEVQFKTMIEALPPFVAEKIERYLRAKMLRGVPLFKDLQDESVMTRLTEKLEQRFAPPYEFVILAGEVGNEMFFLVRGVVEVLVGDIDSGEEKVVATLRTGAYFGEIALVEQDNTRTASIQTVVGCELFVLRKQEFDAILMLSPELQKRITAEVNKRKEAMNKNTHSQPSTAAQSTRSRPRNSVAEPPAEVEATGVFASDNELDPPPPPQRMTTNPDLNIIPASEIDADESRDDLSSVGGSRSNSIAEGVGTPGAGRVVASSPPVSSSPASQQHQKENQAKKQPTKVSKPSSAPTNPPPQQQTVGQTFDIDQPLPAAPNPYAAGASAAMRVLKNHNGDNQYSHHQHHQQRQAHNNSASSQVTSNGELAAHVEPSAGWGDDNSNTISNASVSSQSLAAGGNRGNIIHSSSGEENRVFGHH